jgi:hypothetical protein
LKVEVRNWKLESNLQSLIPNFQPTTWANPSACAVRLVLASGLGAVQQTAVAQQDALVVGATALAETIFAEMTKA